MLGYKKQDVKKTFSLNENYLKVRKRSIKGNIPIDADFLNL
ncbi:hypothetical protein VIBNISO65_1080001 [Vibrio nigripulchritudo SO65]|nr:hypothetical protein VIBNIAM115_1090001 [Vibrio nigripulchritudo AM115]CCN41735.1 hypothetical protein VIBNIFTn2_190001 [Vibrio nigripulchritudo FTn2]CCN66451.1 hypothetical protein VIBNIPon4_540001 [Vibrio nigripulchritudo POn4]CCN74377.1 hypothetical protein VIBNISO65_1080001 [Vibrio nigripulchritudo SO65]